MKTSPPIDFSIMILAVDIKLIFHGLAVILLRTFGYVSFFIHFFGIGCINFETIYFIERKGHVDIIKWW